MLVTSPRWLGEISLFSLCEGVSYLVLLGIVGWSLYTKVTTSKDLPAGDQRHPSSPSPLTNLYNNDNSWALSLA